MSLASTQLIHVQDIPDSGRGVVAAVPIPSGTCILATAEPAAHVVFREYRKEVCAQCFHYDRGRTLPLRDSSTGKVFCSEDCKQKWILEQGELELQAWAALQAFVQGGAKGSKEASNGAPDGSERPSNAEIEAAWREAEALSCDPKAATANVRVRPDPDTLAFFLSGLLEHHRNPSEWLPALLELAMDTQPYPSSNDLLTHTSAFVTLANQILPSSLISACETSTLCSICHALVSAASHNAFGIRGGSGGGGAESASAGFEVGEEEAGEEYMGYAVYPQASYFNHSCSPNVAKRRVGRKWEFRARRDIALGEECCITYLGGDERELDVHQRRGRLRDVWGFVCGCNRCTKESA